jgi:LPS export ABC transporter protein LptC
VKSKKSVWRIISPFIILSLMIITIKLIHRDANNTRRTAIKSFIHDTTIKKFNASGQNEYTLISPFMINSNKPDQSIATKPILHLQSPLNTLWLIKANKATSISQHHQLILTGNVFCHRKKNQQHPSMTLKTQYLIYNTISQEIFCPTHTTILQAGVTTEFANVTINTKNQSIRGKNIKTIEPKKNNS